MTSQKKLCVVDDDPDLLKLITVLFRKEYEVVTCKDGREALHVLETYVPDLLLVDMMMPEMDGFELCQHLKQDPGTAYLPIVMLTAKKDLESRLRGLKLGVVDYIEKPFNHRELRIRVQNILDQYERYVPSLQQANTVDEKKIALLRAIQEKGDQRLVPQVDYTRFLGYRYPEVTEIFASQNEDDDLMFLEDLAERGALAKEVHDKIHLCPFCNHHDINFREVCPNCSSVDIDVMDMIHHFRCAYVGPEKEFRQGPEYVCPKCKRTLHHIGVDYEKPSRSYICNSCRHAFSEAPVRCLSLHCQKFFDVEDAVVRPVHTYTLTERGRLAIEQGHLEEATIEHAFWDVQLELYTISYFNQQLALELSRSRRYGRPFSVMLLELGNLEDLREEHGQIVVWSLLKALVQIIKENSQDIDIPARNTDTQLLFLLAETPLEEARIVADRIRKWTETFKYKMLLHISVVEYPRSGKTVEELLEGLSTGILRAQERGGNRTVVYIKE